ncbi:MAG: hypothetical protein CMJ69_04275 [Planctomycetaceae bacterium]|nr:hypothetical protein [Planctomycetaceae bacterium]
MMADNLSSRWSGVAGPIFAGLVAAMLTGGGAPTVMAAEMKLVGPAQGVSYTKLGSATHRTKYLIENGFDGVRAGLEEDEFFDAIADREKKTDTVLLLKSVSKKRIIKSILKQSKSVRKDHKKKYTKQDTKNIEKFLESAEFAKEYPRGTRFVFETGKGDRKPAYVILSADGRKLSRSEVTEAEQIKSLRKFLGLQEEWLKHYTR